MKTKILSFIVILALFLISCGKKEVQRFEESRFLFGTYIKIIVYDSDKDFATKSIDKAFAEIQRIDEKFNSKTEGSLIYNLNTTDNKTVKLDEEGLKLFDGVSKAYEISGHKYDVTIAPLLELWGFTEDSIELPNLNFHQKKNWNLQKDLLIMKKLKFRMMEQ